MEIYNRKVTTAKALSEMKNLFDKVNAKTEESEDMHNFNGNKTFFCKVVADNGLVTCDYNYRSWILTEGTIVFRGGEFMIRVTDEDHEYNPKVIDSSEFIYDIKKINFSDMFNAFTEMLKQYNERAKQKDEQIERFIEIATQF